MILLGSLRAPGARRLIRAFSWRLCAVLFCFVLVSAIAHFVTVQYLAFSPSGTATFSAKNMKSLVSPVGGALHFLKVPMFWTPEPPIARFPPSKADSVEFASSKRSERRRRTRAVQTHSQTRSWSQSLIPRRFHHMFRDDCLPVEYAMSLRAIVQLHAFRDAGSSNCSYTSTSPNTSIKALPSALIASTKAESQHDEMFDYYFWSDSALNDLKRDCPESADPLCHAFAMALSTIELTDMARYLVMYELGGVYADFDVEFLRPIDALLERGYPCIISAENPIQVINYSLCYTCFVF